MAVMKKDGPQIIDAMVGKFQGIVDGLEKGVGLCEMKQEQNTKVIAKLSDENYFLAEKTEQAATFRDNLKAMLTKKPEDQEPKNKEDKKE